MKKSAMPLTLTIAALIPMHLPAHAIAQRAPIVADAASAQTAAPLSPKQRGALARLFVLRWGNHVERVYDVKVGVWAQRMVPTLASADATNLRNALSRATFEGAMAELIGRGSRTSDQRAMADLGRAALTGRHEALDKALGSAAGDLVYTPIQPCRIVDTRVTPQGAIPANSIRSFVALNLDYSGQGGSATDCGTGGTSLVGAVALNVTAVTPGGAGYATVFPYATTQPQTSSVNYTAGAIVNNAIITRIPNPLTNSDFTIYTFAQSHFVVDIVGYFSAPQATALQCVQSAIGTVDIPAGGTATTFSPACPAGYAKVSNSCDTTSTSAYLTISAIGGCQARNTSASLQQLNTQSTCCRVPGR
ncbi:MAG: hypothetical protein JNM58_08200 [Xanthomonadaceae bacterium]|nr:hypothetical protein [Xanthomonadaceae bacterium]